MLAGKADGNKCSILNNPLMAPDPHFTCASVHIQNFLVPVTEKISWGSGAVNCWNLKKLCNCGIDSMFTNLHLLDLCNCIKASKYC